MTNLLGYLNQQNKINTDADSNVKGISLQKLRAVDRLLTSVIDKKKAIMCTIEYVDDVFQIDMSKDKPLFTTEQDKSYESNFSLNSKEIKNSLRIFLDNWLSTIDTSESITFVFYTNTNFVKEYKVGKLKDLDLPDKPILQLLVDGKYDVALPYVKAVVSDYYLEQHKKHTKNLKPYEQVLDNLDDAKWITFLSLIQWNFGEPNEQLLRKNINDKVSNLCVLYDVDTKYSQSISAQLIDMIEMRSFESDFLEKLVHVGEVSTLFLEKVRDVKVVDSLDPMHKRWENINCDDVRNIQEKILHVCSNYDSDELDILLDDYADGLYEQKNHNNLKAVMAYNYRVYSVCRRLLKAKIKEIGSTFTVDQINSTLEELVTAAEIHLKDKSQTYTIAYNDKDMIRKAIIILFEQCYLAFDKKEDMLNG